MNNFWPEEIAKLWYWEKFFGDHGQDWQINFVKYFTDSTWRLYLIGEDGEESLWFSCVADRVPFVFSDESLFTSICKQYQSVKLMRVKSEPFETVWNSGDQSPTVTIIPLPTPYSQLKSADIRIELPLLHCREWGYGVADTSDIGSLHNPTTEAQFRGLLEYISISSYDRFIKNHFKNTYQLNEQTRVDIKAYEHRRNKLADQVKRQQIIYDYEKLNINR